MQEKSPKKVFNPEKYNKELKAIIDAEKIKPAYEGNVKTGKPKKVK